MREKYSGYISKFDSPMTCYVYEAWFMSGDFGDEDASDPDGSGDWASRYGKRILWGNDRGSVGLSTFENVQEAKAAFQEFADSLSENEEED